MFLKELEAVLLPWWLLAVLLTGDRGAWHIPILVVALYIVLTEIRYRMAVAESQRAGFKRLVRMPVFPWLIRIILWRRIEIPHDVKCYTVHVHGHARSHKVLIRELRHDMELGSQMQAVYVGNTYSEISLFAKRQFGSSRVTVIDGALFGRWLQVWKTDKKHWRIVKIDTRQPISNVFDVAAFFLSQERPDERWTITHLKLQKLVYYAQGWSLALRSGQPLFMNTLEAWEHGPVSPELYRGYRVYGLSDIPQCEFSTTPLDEDDLRLLTGVWSKYGFKDARALEFKTHEEALWKNAWEELQESRGKASREITRESMEVFFRSLLTG